jgi:hypothetical protein
MSAISDLQSALASKAFETIDVSASQNQVRIIGRLPEEQAIFENWQLTLHRLLTVMQTADWKVDPSKKYEIREADNKLVYKWRLIFQGQDIARYFGQIAQTIRTAPRSNRVEMTKFQLTGARPRKYDGHVGPTGRVATGAAAKRR